MKMQVLIPLADILVISAADVFLNNSVKVFDGQVRVLIE